ncbi:MAG TPA: S46 family peptidase [Chitinophagales bacterium]|nr:S46 family peptidase [Chitinophagales bacterium]
MKKLLVLLLLAAPFLSRADEGMWLVNLVQVHNYEKMKAMGFNMPASAIYNENAPSLKDAIVSFGDFCTGEFVSKEGLVFTNHHCGYDAIASLSTPGDKNYLDNGFWARSKDQELPAKGLFVKVLVSMREVTDSIVPQIKNLTGNDRSQKITEITKRMSDAANPDKKFKIEVKPFYAGNQYFLFVYQVYNDVRLVGTAPQAVGKFGGDTDNWMWPRHTGDFSIFRVYSAPDGSPAEYSASNVPFKPKYSLNVSIAPLKEGDFTMIMGYPGSTDRYQTKYGIDYVEKVQNPMNIQIFGAVTDAMKTEMDKDEATKLKLASSYASLRNGYKLYQGQLDGFARIKPTKIKNDEETAFINYVNSLPATEKEQYATVLRDIENAYKQLASAAPIFIYPFYTSLLPPSAKVATSLKGMEADLKRKMPSDSVKMMMEGARKDMKEDIDAVNALVEQNMLISLLKLYNKNVPVDQQAPALTKITGGKQDATADAKIEAAVKSMIAKSFVTNPSKLEAYMNKPSAKTLAKDPLVKFYSDLQTFAADKRVAFLSARNSRENANRKYVQAVMDMNKGKKIIYPDANFTMRLTYGTVQDYVPRDGVLYDWQTYADGIMEKYKAGDLEFDVPQEVRTAIEKKDYGRYAVNGRLPVCFLTTHDITGGNSGSPVLNANGEWIGTAFDGNYEGTATQYVFEDEMNRTISASSNYVLWIIDKVYGATNIIQELNVVTTSTSSLN